MFLSSNFSRSSTHLLTCAIGFAVICSAIASAEPSVPPASNWAELILMRTDDAGSPGAFHMWINVSLEAEVGVTGVTVTTGGGSVWVLSNDFGDPSFWSYKEAKASAAAVVAESDGTWTIEISGTSPSTTTFTVNTSSLVDGDFFPTPTGVFPANGATDVPADVTMSWSDPTGGSTPDALVISVDGPTSNQDDNSLLGSLLITDTSWKPPLDLEIGSNVLEVDYALADGARIGAFNVTAGSIVWGDHPLAAGLPGYPASSPLLGHGSYTRVSFTAVPPPPPNWVELTMMRSDDAESPGAFNMRIVVKLQGEVGVTGVTVTTGGASEWALTQNVDDPFDWFRQEARASAAAIVAETDGTWTIEIFGSSPSTTTFTVNSSGLTDGDFFPTPTGISPANGAVDVPVNTILLWNDPTGASTAEAMAVSADGMTLLQDDDTLFGSLLITDTSWDPPLDLEPGANVWEVDYAVIDETLIGALSVTAGSITWSDHPISQAIPGYPATSPLLIHGSYARTLFTVFNACPADTDGNGDVSVVDLLDLLGAWGPCGAPCPQDINGDGQVSVVDLLALLGAWGACP